MALENAVYLDRLPQELFDNIMCNITDHADISRLSRTCKAIRSLTLELVFENVSMLWDRKKMHFGVPEPERTALLREQKPCVTCTTETNSGCECPRLDLLLRSLVENPELGNFVRKVDLQCVDWNRARFGWELTLLPPPNTDEYQALLLDAMRRTGISESRLKNEFEDGLEINKFEIVVNFFLVLCPNITSLTLGVDIVADNPVLSLLFEDYALPPENSGYLLRLQHLTDIHLGTESFKHCGGILDRCVRTEPGKQLLSALESYFKLFYLPELKLAQIELPLLADGWRKKELQLPTEANPSSTMQVLLLRQCALAPAILSNIFKLAPYITRLDYGFELYSSDKMQARDLNSALACIKTSLKHLRFSLGMWSAGDQFEGQYLEFYDEFEYVEGYCSLKEFAVLETVRIPSCVLLGWTNSKSPDLADVLPENLVDLYLTDDFCWCDSYEKEEEEMMPILRKFVSNDDWRRTSPRLENFDVLYCDWENKDETVALFKQNGLSCQIKAPKD